jgi:hypothetical protein
MLLLSEDSITLPAEREEFRSVKLKTTVGSAHIHDNDAWFFEGFYTEVPLMGTDGKA